MEKKLIFLVVSLIMVNGAFSQTVPIITAQKVAKNFYFERAYNHDNNVKYSDIQLSSIQVETIDNDSIYYVFNNNANKGWIIVSAQQNVVPVLAYSLKGAFDTVKANQPPAFKEWMNSYKTQIQYAISYNLTADTANTAKWTYYNSNVAKSSPKQIQSIGPLLQTTWDQGCYYNAMCPTDNGGPCNKVWAGCVATAMAQIMKYWNYPTTGSGTNTDINTNYGTLSANFGATTYNWANMPNNVTSSNTDVATLIYHCGIAVNMLYGNTAAGGSSASLDDARMALFNYFSYAFLMPNLILITKSDYSASDWNSAIVAQLDNYWPILYRGEGSSGAHAFVCDGYDASDHFHFNWGWGGAPYDCYCYLSSLVPNTSSDDFTSTQMAVINIRPLDCPPIRNITTNYSNPSGTWDFEASNYITASNIVSGGADVTYDAKNYVDLTDGFQVAAGSTFQAVIDGCGGFQKTLQNNKSTGVAKNANIVNNQKLKITQEKIKSNYQIEVPFSTHYYIQILNAAGSIVKTISNCTGNIYTINLSDLPEDSYTVKAIAGSEEYNVVIKK